jgi:hypothetical protein
MAAFSLSHFLLSQSLKEIRGPKLISARCIASLEKETKHKPANIFQAVLVDTLEDVQAGLAILRAVKQSRVQLIQNKLHLIVKIL